MRTSRKLLVLGLVLGLASCSEDGGDGESKQTGGVRRNLLITGEVPHAHIHKEVVSIFTVRDLDDCTTPGDETTCKAVSGLPVKSFTRFTGDTAPRQQELAAGLLEDNGDGTYSFYNTFTAYGGYTVGIEFELDGEHYFGAFAMSSALAGGEGYRCDLGADGKVDHVFQLRWSSTPGDVVADGTEVKFDFQPQRSFNTELNLEKPYSNQFDFLAAADFEGGAPKIELMAGEAPGTLVEALTPTYQGKGVYRVTKKFAAADLGSDAQKTFWFRVSFKDTKGCSVDNTAAADGKPTGDPENYYFSVKAAQ